LLFFVLTYLLTYSGMIQQQVRADRHDRCWRLACQEAVRVRISPRLWWTAERHWPHVVPGAGWHDHHSWNVAVLQVRHTPLADISFLRACICMCVIW